MKLAVCFLVLAALLVCIQADIRITKYHNPHCIGIGEAITFTPSTDNETCTPYYDGNEHGNHTTEPIEIGYLQATTCSAGLPFSFNTSRDDNCTIEGDHFTVTHPDHCMINNGTDDDEEEDLKRRSVMRRMIKGKTMKKHQDEDEDDELLHGSMHVSCAGEAPQFHHWIELHMCNDFTKKRAAHIKHVILKTKNDGNDEDEEKCGCEGSLMEVKTWLDEEGCQPIYNRAGLIMEYVKIETNQSCPAEVGTSYNASLFMDANCTIATTNIEASARNCTKIGTNTITMHCSGEASTSPEVPQTPTWNEPSVQSPTITTTPDITVPTVITPETTTPLEPSFQEPVNATEPTVPISSSSKLATSLFAIAATVPLLAITLL